MPLAPTKDARPTRALVLQGGGALGSYQAGVYEALGKSGFEPDWIAGISIGAINASLIAGNAPEDRVQALNSFWERVSAPLPYRIPFASEPTRALLNQSNAAFIAAFGVSGFFVPRLAAPVFLPAAAPGGVSFYDTAPLRSTLEGLVDFDRINAQELRLSLGAVNLRTGALTYFDNSTTRIGPEHVMASGALPPGFPPVEIDGAWYWDGGVLSNTPLEYVMDSHCDGDLQIFQVDLFNAHGAAPRTILEASEREKDIRYASRTLHNTALNMRSHALKAALKSVLAALPEHMHDSPDVKLLAPLAVDHRVKVLQLIYRRKPYEGNTKDYEFSRATMEEHWRAGVEDAARLLKHPERLACYRSSEIMDPALQEP